MTTAAQQLSEWIESTHPEFFDVLYAYVQRQGRAVSLGRARLRGFGQDDDTDFSIPDISSSDIDLAVAPTDLTADLSQAASPSEAIDFTAGNAADNAIVSQYTPAAVNIPTLSASDLSLPTTALPNTSIGPQDSGSLDVSTDNSSSGFLQSLGSGVATAAGSVAKFLTSSQGLNAMAQLGTAYFKLATSQTNAQIQQQVLQAQIARATQGASPAPITYAVGANGQLVPVYATPLTNVGTLQSSLPNALQAAITSGASQPIILPNGTTGYTVPSNLLGSLTGAPSMTDLLPWILLIGGGLILLKELSK